MDYDKELRVAIQAVTAAGRVTLSVFQTDVKPLDKPDKSPVTVADFAAQTVVNALLTDAFPDDEIVGEEDSSELQSPETGLALRHRILSLANSVLDQPILMEHLLAIIDRGQSQGGPKGRFWALDPIDGTRGFLRGGQYAVCLALIVDGEVQVGALCCPNLNEPVLVGTDRGRVFAAVKGQGAFMFPSLNTSQLEKRVSLSVSSNSVSNTACFCESVEAGHSDHYLSASIAQELGIKKQSVKMDSQCKYGLIACGRADIYMRFPTRPDYEEKIWDHAAGDLIVREAGGQVTDIEGKRLDFSRGRTLKYNKGVLASNGQLHERLLEAVKKSMASASL